ncbi:MAG: GNAT family N-acetyltransferase [Candidatus Thorarchaeota archaeon]
MVRTVIRTWKDLDIGSLAELTSEVRRIEGLGNYTTEQMEIYIRNMNERFPIEIAVLALEEERVIGWIAMERATQNIGELSRWHPFVVHDVDSEEVGRAMISEVISYARTHGVTRIEIGFGEISDENLVTFKQRSEWYEAEGWQKLEDSYFMAIDPCRAQIQDIEIPKGYKTKSLLDVKKEALFSVYHDAFMTGGARWIHDLTVDERRQEFEKSFDQNNKINEHASIVIKSDDDIVGYALVLSRPGDEEHLQTLAVVQSARRQGLAKFMLKSILETLKARNITNLTLGTDPENVPAITLYRNFGFETVSRLARYSWKDATI